MRDDRVTDAQFDKQIRSYKIAEKERIALEKEEAEVRRKRKEHNINSSEMKAKMELERNF